jgi:hypothetical protein
VTSNFCRRKSEVKEAARVAQMTDVRNVYRVFTEKPLRILQLIEEVMEM